MIGEVDMMQFATHVVTLVLVVSSPPIIVASLVGIFVSVLQTLTQLQDQTFVFAVKVLSVTLTIFLTSTWFGAEIYKFTVHILSVVSAL